ESLLRNRNTGDRPPLITSSSKSAVMLSRRYATKPIGGELGQAGLHEYTQPHIVNAVALTDA
ncbi:hypothetical protein, partial [Sphingomonas psychrolutea]|uniref:hypothetical protein n=1 Tax=Sphingomonas psychrolutea TaxID=1259676 RepID=UPI001E343048